MAHFAKLDETNKVIDILVVANSELLDSEGVEQEALGIEFLTTLFGSGWYKQTSYNGENYAGIGYTYNTTLNAFIPPTPFPSWILNTSNEWQAPVTYPDDGLKYNWDEPTTSWVEVTGET